MSIYHPGLLGGSSHSQQDKLVSLLKSITNLEYKLQPLSFVKGTPIVCMWAQSKRSLVSTKTITQNILLSFFSKKPDRVAQFGPSR